MRISNDNNINYKGANLSKLAKPLNVFYDKNSFIPTLLIETGVTLGRTYEAYKTGGKKEAIERFIEQGVSAVVWLGGVQVINKTISLIAEFFKKGISSSKNFKAGNMLASLAIATGFIGFVLPKINHYISKKIIEQSNQKKDKKTDTAIKIKTIDEFKKQNNKNPSFTSLVSVANAFEKNNNLRLLVTDAGVIAGRYKNGRNKYEKIEGLFRDIASIYFYLGFTKDFVGLMNKLTKNTDVSPKVIEKQYKKLKEMGFNTDDFIKVANSTIRKNFAFYMTGTALSTFALGILIPKVQYMLRRKLTNKDQFPGDDGYKVGK